jgi:hypothetical protein
MTAPIGISKKLQVFAQTQTERDRVARNLAEVIDDLYREGAATYAEKKAALLARGWPAEILEEFERASEPKFLEDLRDEEGGESGASH